MNYSSEDLSRYRIQKARQTWEEAVILAESAHWSAVANRLYYSCFYAILALFAKYNLKAVTHSGVKHMFHLKILKSGIIEEEYGILFTVLTSKRHIGDYQDFYEFTEEEVQPLIEEVKRFIERVERQIV